MSWMEIMKGTGKAWAINLAGFFEIYKVCIDIGQTCVFRHGSKFIKPKSLTCRS